VHNGILVTSAREAATLPLLLHLHLTINSPRWLLVYIGTAPFEGKGVLLLLPSPLLRRRRRHRQEIEAAAWPIERRYLVRRCIENDDGSAVFLANDRRRAAPIPAAAVYFVSAAAVRTTTLIRRDDAAPPKGGTGSAHRKRRLAWGKMNFPFPPFIGTLSLNLTVVDVDPSKKESWRSVCSFTGSGEMLIC